MRGWEAARRIVGHLLASALVAIAAATGAAAIDIELTDVASDRVERQRAYARGATPLSGTPDLASLDQRLAAKGLAKGNPIFIRVFKETSELEVWMQRESDKTFVLLDTYPICHWTGTIGPKIREGDRQSPEGFYTVRWQQTRLVGRWQKAFNLGFPNHYDQINGRTGSHILVHGGCSSVGCYAMTEQVQDEIFSLASAAIAKGQHRFHVHAFPFRMTDENLERHKYHLWSDFWRDLKAGYDSFERTRQPPRVAICEQRYQIADGDPDDAGNPNAHNLLRPPPQSKTEPEIGYRPPRCEIEGERTRTARQTSTTVEADEPGQPARAKPRTRAAAAATEDEPAQSKPAKKVRAKPAASGNGVQSPATGDDSADGGLGNRPNPSAPRVLSNGG
ncbi:MAG: hypothetical protein ACKVP7_08415 [Hyphomicrobiaceae bacterium]